METHVSSTASGTMSVGEIIDYCKASIRSCEQMLSLNTEDRSYVYLIAKVSRENESLQRQLLDRGRDAHCLLYM